MRFILVCSVIGGISGFVSGFTFSLSKMDDEMQKIRQERDHFEDEMAKWKMRAMATCDHAFYKQEEGDYTL